MSSSILNMSHAYDYTFEVVRKERPHLAKKKTLIAESYYEAIESRLKIRLFADVRKADAKGERKTLTPDTHVPRDPNLPWLINQSQLRKYLEMAMNGTTITLVSPEYVDYCDHVVRAVISTHVASMMTTGKVIR